MTSRLTLPDCILEEATLEQDTLSFVASGGNPETLVQCLADGYVGTAQMCNLVGEWLSVFDDDVDEKLAQSTSTRNRQSNSSVSSTATTALKKDDDNDAANRQQAQSNIAMAVVENHLKTLITQRFDPKKADTIWGQKAAPVWLEFMISQFGWRSLLYRLSTEHKDCLMLNFAIQRISDAGHQSEIASLATASTYFSVFNRVLIASLSALQNADEDALNEALPGLVAMTCRTQHTYAYALAVLRRVVSMTDEAGNVIVRPAVAAAAARLARELEQRAEHRVPATAVALRLALPNFPHANAMASVSLMTSAQATNPSDIIQLFNAYTQPTPPPVSLLRHATLLELLARDLFEPANARRLHQTHRHKYLHLLALAAAGSGSELGATRDVLDAAQRTCVRGPLATHERADARAALRAAVALPIGALCLLVWLEAQWAERQFFTVSYDAELFGDLLALLVEIVERHALQNARVLRVLAAPITLAPGADLDALVALELKRHALDTLWGLMVRGRSPLPALAALRSWQRLGALDHSLIRRFIDRFLGAIVPPFSRDFVAAFVAFCSDDLTLLALRAANAATIEHVVRFIAACNSSFADDSSLAQQLVALSAAVGHGQAK